MQAAALIDAQAAALIDAQAAALSDAQAAALSDAQAAAFMIPILSKPRRTNTGANRLLIFSEYFVKAVVFIIIYDTIKQRHE